MKAEDYAEIAEDEVNFCKSIVSTSPTADKSVSLMEALLVDCPMPSNTDFRKMLGVQAAICFRLSLSLMTEVNSKPKIDRDLLRLAMKVMEMSGSFCEKGSRVSVLEGVEED